MVITITLAIFFPAYSHRRMVILWFTLPNITFITGGTAAVIVLRTNREVHLAILVLTVILILVMNIRVIEVTLWVLAWFPLDNGETGPVGMEIRTFFSILTMRTYSSIEFRTQIFTVWIKSSIQRPEDICLQAFRNHLLLLFQLVDAVNQSIDF